MSVIHVVLIYNSFYILVESNCLKIAGNPFIGNMFYYGVTFNDESILYIMNDKGEIMRGVTLVKVTS